MLQLIIFLLYYGIWYTSERLIAMNGLFSNDQNNLASVGKGLTLEYNQKKEMARLYRRGQLIKQADLTDSTEKRLFVVDAVEQGCNQTQLATTLGISRQTIHNYMETKKYFGIEGLIHGYNPQQTKNRRKQRRLHSSKRSSGNTARKLEQLRKNKREQAQKSQADLFDISAEDKKHVSLKEQPYSEQYDWQYSRYAGVFCYIIALIHQWKWLDLIQSYVGVNFKIFLIFMLMAARNIGSIEQLKNVRKREAGLILGFIRFPCRTKLWENFYQIVHQGLSSRLLRSYFLYQLRSGLVSLWLWFTDGHLLPYDGKHQVHYSYNTQRQKPYPGQTNFVTCDNDGRIVDFEIQEGKGDIHGRIKSICNNWKDEVPFTAVQVFDRENYGTERFIEYVDQEIPFVCWDKYVDTPSLNRLSDELFVETLTFNDKCYKYFESEKRFSYTLDNNKPHENRSVTLRHFTIWNLSSNRRTCGLASPLSLRELSACDCVKAILSRWGASENTFKHIQNRHPFHYHPGFRMVDSENQQISNPEIKELTREIQKKNKKLSKLCKELSKAEASESGRKNSAFDRLKDEIASLEQEIKQLKQQKNNLPEKVDVSSLENYRSFKKIDNEGKNLFDFATSSVWNARKQMVAWLRDYYDQENDIVDLFYAITECHGWIKSQSNKVIVRLEPLQQPKRRVAQEQLCRKLTGFFAETMNGKKLIVEVGESPLT